MFNGNGYMSGVYGELADQVCLSAVNALGVLSRENPQVDAMAVLFDQLDASDAFTRSERRCSESYDDGCIPSTWIYAGSDSDLLLEFVVDRDGGLTTVDSCAVRRAVNVERLGSLVSALGYVSPVIGDDGVTQLVDGSGIRLWRCDLLFVNDEDGSGCVACFPVVFPSKYEPSITAGERVAVTNLVDDLTVGSQGGRELKADALESLKKAEVC